MKKKTKSKIRKNEINVNPERIYIITAEQREVWAKSTLNTRVTSPTNHYR
jgi:hypothetical protein